MVANTRPNSQGLCFGGLGHNAEMDYGLSSALCERFVNRSDGDFSDAVYIAAALSYSLRYISANTSCIVLTSKSIKCFYSVSMCVISVAIMGS